MTSEPGQPDTPDSEETSLSQNELDALFTKPDASSDGSSEGIPAPTGQTDADAAQASEPESHDDVGGDAGFSQADIDALMNSATADDESGDEASEPAEAGVPEPDTRVDTMGRPFDEFAAAMQAAIDDEKPAGAPAAQPPHPPVPTKPLPLNDFTATAPADGNAHRVSMLHDVKLGVKIELGRTRMLVEDVLKMDEGSVVELDKLAGDPVDIYANDRLVARGEVLILADNFCVRISEVITQDPHRVAR